MSESNLRFLFESAYFLDQRKTFELINNYIYNLKKNAKKNIKSFKT